MRPVAVERGRALAVCPPGGVGWGEMDPDRTAKRGAAVGREGAALSPPTPTPTLTPQKNPIREATPKRDRGWYGHYTSVCLEASLQSSAACTGVPLLAAHGVPGRVLRQARRTVDHMLRRMLLQPHLQLPRLARARVRINISAKRDGGWTGNPEAERPPSP